MKKEKKIVDTHCFGRISESVFNDLKSLDDLIDKMGKTKDGYKIAGVGEPNYFKNSLESYKKYLETELHEFSNEELLKIDKHFQKLKKIYDWYGYEYLLTAMEYEARENTSLQKDEGFKIKNKQMKKGKKVNYKVFKCGKKIATTSTYDTALYLAEKFECTIWSKKSSEQRMMATFEKPH